MTGMTATPDARPDAAIAPEATTPALVPLPGAAPRAPGTPRGKLFIKTRIGRAHV